MTITQKDVRDYKKLCKEEWRDEKWHALMCTWKSQAIGYALDHKDYDGGIRDVISSANSYLENI